MFLGAGAPFPFVPTTALYSRPIPWLFMFLDSAFHTFCFLQTRLGGPDPADGRDTPVSGGLRRCLLASTFSGEVWLPSSGLWFGASSFPGSCAAASCSGLSRQTLGTCSLCSTLHSETQGSHTHTAPHVGTRSPRFRPVNSFSFAKHVRVTFKGVYRLT